jgi:hypothetical protein
VAFVVLLVGCGSTDSAPDSAAAPDRAAASAPALHDMSAIGLRCHNWLSPDLSIVACNPDQLQYAFTRHRLSREGSMRADITPQPRKQQRAPGMLQVAGPLLKPGTRVVFTGSTKGTFIVLQAIDATSLVQARFDDVAVPKGQQAVITIAGGGKNWSIVLSDRKHLHRRPDDQQVWLKTGGALTPGPLTPGPRSSRRPVRQQLHQTLAKADAATRAAKCRPVYEYRNGTRTRFIGLAPPAPQLDARSLSANSLKYTWHFPSSPKKCKPTALMITVDPADSPNYTVRVAVEGPSGSYVTRLAYHHGKRAWAGALSARGVYSTQVRVAVHN